MSYQPFQTSPRRALEIKMEEHGFIEEIEEREAVLDEVRALPPICDQCGEPYGDSLPCLCQ